MASYELDAWGECQHCGADIDAIVRNLPRAERIVLLMCSNCDSITAWVPSSGQESAKEGDDITEAITGSDPPQICRYCAKEKDASAPDSEKRLVEWHTLEIFWDQVDRGEREIHFNATCPECGRSSRIGCTIGTKEVFGPSRQAGCMLWSFILLSPILLILSPLLIPLWIIWMKKNGKCLRCSHPLVNYGNLPLVAEDGGGSLHRCPKCSAFYYLPIMGPVDARRFSREEVRKNWPDLQNI